MKELEKRCRPPSRTAGRGGRAERTRMQISDAAQLVLLRTALPAPALRPGAVLAARVLENGMLALAGSRVRATLPDDVQPGEALRLRVKEIAPERIVLQIVPDPPPAATAAVALPGGATARIVEDDEGAGARGSGRAVVLRYDSPTLGRLDIRLTTSGATVHATEGPPAAAARAAAGDLAAALGAPVAVVGRRSALDARA
jgi:hypothetical protein